ncbi:MAG TPA: type II toxin-antitoxin system VapC family toxin [Pyrinomonadaceae bacterium]|nr:type II toxin-antitoxin system VapC family toxin [Pyrinomonadaceae bacterium]
MTYLVDTNVLLRIIQVNHSMHADAIRVAATLADQGHELFVVGQNLIEFWAVATRPESSNGLALSIADTAAHIKTFQQTFTLLPDTPEIFFEWQRLVEAHSVSGRQAHDARLVAAMIVHQVTYILTFNTDDFKRFSDIKVVNPQNIP